MPNNHSRAVVAAILCTALLFMGGLATSLGGVTQAAQTVTTTAAKAVCQAGLGYRAVTVYNGGTTPVYVGGSALTAATGIPICSDVASACAGTSWTVAGSELFLIVSAGTQAVRLNCAQ